MLFNSIDFAIFLPIIFIIYWFVTGKNIKYQNLLILIASYVFYGWWDWRFLSLIFFSTIVDYTVGLNLGRYNKPSTRKILLIVSICVNLGLLGFFKYYNFFLDNINTAFSFLGQSVSLQSLHIILPVGISFYTFQTLSYTIDIYNKKINPTRDFLSFAAFVSFFPQLVAGPIERASNLLPQFKMRRRFNYDDAADGLRQILWGLIKKVVIADNCAQFVDMIFNSPGDYSGSTLFLGALFFTFQIYGDFSGYSDIAIGTARLFGFKLMRNFAFPYFSRDIAEFWRRWHISLTTWFRDYLYIPLGGSRVSLPGTIRNTFIIFLVSGFWHGANWTYVAWGGVHALLFLPLLIMNKNRNNIDLVAKDKKIPSLKELVNISVTFFIVVLTWILFRADNISHASEIFKGIFSVSLFTIPSFNGMEKALMLIIMITLFMIIEWVGREHNFAIERIGINRPRFIRWSFYSFLIFLIGMYMQTTETPFIYFQF